MATPSVTHGRKGTSHDRSRQGYLTPDAPYVLEDFLDDQRRLMSSARPGMAVPVRRVTGVDGRMLVIDLDRLRRVASGSSQAVQVFLQKYGRHYGECRLAQFRRVLDFLSERDGDIRFAGLADSREPLRVREEFVSYLLKRHIDPGCEKMPDGVLMRFLDDWGHRWM